MASVTAAATASSSTGTLVCTSLETLGLDTDEENTALDFIQKAGTVTDTRIEGLTYSTPDELGRAYGKSFVLELKEGDVAPVSDAIGERTEDDIDVFSYMNMVFEGFVVYVRFAGEQGLDHLCEKHLKEGISELGRAFSHVELPIVILRTEEGLAFVMTSDGVMERAYLSSTVREVLQIHYTDEDAGDWHDGGLKEEACKEMEVTILDLPKDQLAVEQVLPQFKQLQEWALRIDEWYIGTHLSE